METLCQLTRMKKLPNSTNSPHEHTVLLLPITGKKITRPDSIIPKRRWNIRIRLLSCRRKLMENLSTQRGSHKQLFSGIARVCLLVQYDAQERSVDLKSVIVVLNEAQFPELVHEKIDP